MKMVSFWCIYFVLLFTDQRLIVSTLLYYIIIVKPEQSNNNMIFIFKCEEYIVTGSENKIHTLITKRLI